MSHSRTLSTVRLSSSHPTAVPSCQGPIQLNHGVSNALRHYIQGYLDGGPPTARPTFRVVRDGPAAAVVDADGALGIHVGTFAMNLAIEKAKEYGVGSVAVRNAGHFG